MPCETLPPSSRLKTTRGVSPSNGISMYKKSMFSLLLYGSLTILPGCAATSQPFADPADAAIAQKAIRALGEYAQTVNVSVVGGRAYLEGIVPNYNDLQIVLEAVRNTEGVISVMEAVTLEEAGSSGPNDDNWK